MKLRNSLVILTLLLFASIVTTSLADKPVGKLIVHDVSEGPFNGGWAKVVTSGTMILKAFDESTGLYTVSSHMIQKLLIYDQQGGELQAVVSINLNYVGTVTDLEGDDGPTENLYTGKMVVTMIVNWFAEGEAPMEDSHWVVWYEEGAVVKEIGFGEMP